MPTQERTAEREPRHRAARPAPRAADRVHRHSWSGDSGRARGHVQRVRRHRAAGPGLAGQARRGLPHLRRGGDGGRAGHRGQLVQRPVLGAPGREAPHRGGGRGADRGRRDRHHQRRHHHAGRRPGARRPAQPHHRDQQPAAASGTTAGRGARRLPHRRELQARVQRHDRAGDLPWHRGGSARTWPSSASAASRPGPGSPRPTCRRRR